MCFALLAASKQATRENRGESAVREQGKGKKTLRVVLVVQVQAWLPGGS